MDKNNADFLKINYADIIVLKNGYEQIKFESFFSRYFDKTIKLIDNRIIAEKIKDKYPNECDDIHKTYFLKYGEEGSILISDLIFYQEYIGINGSRFHDIADPVFVIKYEGKLILWEGYHRILQKMLNKEIFIKSYLLTI